MNDNDLAPAAVATNDHGKDSQLLLNAAHAASCEFAALYGGSPNALQLIAGTGEVEYCDLDENHPITVRIIANNIDPLVLSERIQIGEWPIGCKPTSQNQPLANFVVCVSLNDNLGISRGLLVLGTSVNRNDLSAAQHYLLGTIAAQMLARLRTTKNGSNLKDALLKGGILHERIRLLESVVVNARDSILITQSEPIDLPGPKIVYCNPAFTRTTGYSEQDVLGLTPRILQGPDTDHATLKILKAALEEWRPVEIELLNYRKDGTPFWVELSIVPVADENGWFTHWISVQRDTTERKAAELAAARSREIEKDREALMQRLAEREQAEKALVYAASHDALTSLYNRSFFIDELENALANFHEKSNQTIAVLFLDLNGFKLVNDTLGHATGDTLLIEVAERLARSIKPDDILARLAGDEFVILVDDASTDAELEDLSRRIVNDIGLPIQMGQRELFVSCSVGGVRVTKDYLTAGDILRDADAAMYAAKGGGGGGGGFRIFRREMHERAVEALSMQADLRTALREKSFNISYQPIYNTNSMLIESVEALIRWHHVTRGCVSPSIFIPLAEELGIIEAIDGWVRATAMSHLKTWRARFPTFPLRLNVNVSALELRDERFSSNLENLANTTGFALTDLQLEITEGLLLDDTHRTQALLATLRNMGVRIALDDFGTGYSSLAYLDRYHIDTLKIDRSFVMRMLESPRAMAILESTIALAQKLKLSVVAEGVETEEQLSALQQIGCDHVQGFLLSRPVSAIAITRLLQFQEGILTSSTIGEKRRRNIDSVENEG